MRVMKFLERIGAAVECFIFGPEEEQRPHFKIGESAIGKEPKPVSKANSVKRPARKTAPAKVKKSKAKTPKTKVVRRSRAKAKG